MRRVAVLLLAPVVLVVSSCLGPTEIQVHVTTNACLGLNHVDIYVGSQDASLSAPATSTGGCTAPNDVGTLTIVPSAGVDTPLQLAVVGAIGNGACPSPSVSDPQCIIARRSLSFVPHTHLDLPVYLDSACAGIDCGATGTCVADPTPHCVGSTCDADGGITCSVDAGGPPDASDDFVLEDVTLFDSGPACPVITSGTPKYSWSFETTSVVHEDHGAVPDVPLDPSAKITNSISVCGNYLSGGPQVLSDNNTAFSARSFTVGFAYRTLVDGSVLQLASQSLSSGYEVRINSGQLVVVFDSNVSVEVYRDGATSNDGKWHTAVVEVVTASNDAGNFSSTLRVTRDDVPGKLATTQIPFGGLGIKLSAGGIEAIDQISYFLY